MRPYPKSEQTGGYQPGPKPKKPIPKVSANIKNKAPNKPVDERSTISATTYRQILQKHDRRKKKYNNKSKIYTSAIHGTRTFDSIKEATYCEELDWRLKKGEITHYDLQWKIDIKINGKHWRNYFIDYRVITSTGHIQYIEIKGYETEVWKMKWDALLLLKNELLEDESELMVIK